MILSSVQGLLTIFSPHTPVVNFDPAPPFEEGDFGFAITEVAHSFSKNSYSVAGFVLLTGRTSLLSDGAPLCSG